MKSLKVVAVAMFLGSAILSFGMQAPHPSTPPARIRVSGAVMQALLIHSVAPEYPDEAKRAHATGDVTVDIRIDPEGNVVFAALVRGNPVLADAAIDAVKQWKYRPYLLNGQPIEVETTALVVFKKTTL